MKPSDALGQMSTRINIVEEKDNSRSNKRPRYDSSSDSYGKRFKVGHCVL